MDSEVVESFLLGIELDFLDIDFVFEMLLDVSESGTWFLYFVQRLLFIVHFVLTTESSHLDRCKG